MYNIVYIIFGNFWINFDLNRIINLKKLKIKLLIKNVLILKNVKIC